MMNKCNVNYKENAFCIKERNAISGIMSTNAGVGAILWFLLGELKMFFGSPRACLQQSLER